MSNIFVVTISTQGAVLQVSSFSTVAATEETLLSEVDIDAFDRDGNSVFGTQHVTMATVVEAVRAHRQLLSVTCAAKAVFDEHLTDEPVMGRKMDALGLALGFNHGEFNDPVLLELIAKAEPALITAAVRAARGVRR